MLRLTPSTTQPYVGQEVILTLDLLLPVSIRGTVAPATGELPRLVIPWLQADWEWTEDLENWRKRYTRNTGGLGVLINDAMSPIYPEPVPEAHAGSETRHSHYRLRWLLVAPGIDEINEGRLRLAPVKLIWGTLNLASESVELKLRPVPPDLSSGTRIRLGVGDLSLRASVEPASVTLGQSIRLTLRISGRGPLAKVPRPSLRDLAEALPTTLFALEAAGEDWNASGSERRFHYRLTLRSADVFEVPRIPYACFDPEQGIWRQRATSPVPIKVHVSEPLKPVSPVRLPDGPIPERLRFDILTEADLDTSAPISGRWMLLVLWAAPPVCWLLCLIWCRRATHVPPLTGWSHAARQALARLDRMANTDASELADVMHGYLRERYALSLTEPTDEELRAFLLRAGIPSDTVQAMATWWHQVNAARFSPHASNEISPVLKTLRVAGRELIFRLERIG